MQEGYSTLTYANVKPLQANAAAFCQVQPCRMPHGDHGARMGLKWPPTLLKHVQSLSHRSSEEA